MSCVAPDWYRSLARRRPRVVVRKETDAQIQEKTALLEAKNSLCTEIRNAKEYVEETGHSIAELNNTIIPTLEKEQTKLVETIVTVAAFRERTVETLTNHAIQASLTGDFTKSRSTMRVLDKVSDRLRDLWQRANRVVDATAAAHRKRDEFRYRIGLAHLKIEDCTAQIARLGTWAFHSSFLK
jgi:hypothetical protein